MIEFAGVTKRFGATEVLRGIDLRVERGRIMGLVGPNGAGKTTLIKMLLRLTHPTSGVIRVGSTTVSDDETYRKRIGYMPQIARFPDNLTAVDLFSLLRGLRGGGGESQERLIARFGLTEHVDKPLRVLSGGTRQKVNAAMALLFRPMVLVLDEPTAGLDPLSSATLKDEILARRDEGATVLVASHIMSELEELCDDVGFLLDGSVRYTGPVAELRSMTRQATLERAVAALMIREVA
jgi:Cu-processing system ATP-binding protein